MPRTPRSWGRATLSQARLKALAEAAKKCKSNPDSLAKVKEHVQQEKERLQTIQEFPAIEKVVEMNFDSLFGRGGHPAYLLEMQSCEKLTEVVALWPITLVSPMHACAGAGKNTNDCRDTDIVQLRAQFSGCVCNLAVPMEAQRCTGLMIQSLQSHCPKTVDATCFEKSRAQMTASLGLPLKFNFPRKVASETLLRSRDLND